MFDIYGGRLLSGHCEVHPHVHEPYPCSVCFAESREHQRYKDAEAEYWRQMEIEINAEYERGYWASLGFDPVSMGM